jgi:hypothetical protein
VYEYEYDCEKSSTTQDNAPCGGLHGVLPDVKCAVYVIPVQHMVAQHNKVKARTGKYAMLRAGGAFYRISFQYRLSSSGVCNTVITRRISHTFDINIPDHSRPKMNKTNEQKALEQGLILGHGVSHKLQPLSNACLDITKKQR